MDDVTVISQIALDAPVGDAGVTRQVVFETTDTLVVQSRVAGGVTTGWHHNGDRHVYGYVTSGHAKLEFGPGGGHSISLDEDDFVYVPPQTIRRVVNPSDDDFIIVISFVGTGPHAVAVEGPLPETDSVRAP